MILIERNKEFEILAWMSAVVTIITSESNNTLTIPALSLLQNNNKNFVYLKNSETWEFKLKEVEVWIRNNFEIEVIEWLKKWDIIKSSVLDDAELEKMWIDEWWNSPFGG